MNKIAALLITVLFAVLSTTAYAQQPAAGKSQSQSSDPLVQKRDEEAAVKKTYKEKVSAAKRERSAKMKPMINASIKTDTAKGVEPQIAKRDAESKAKAATRAEYDAKVKAAKTERDAALADIRKKYAPAKK